jgi:hypothetical protein
MAPSSALCAPVKRLPGGHVHERANASGMGGPGVAVLLGAG